MRVLVQRVTASAVAIAGQEVGRIGRGLTLLVGIAPTDTETEVAWMVLDLLPRLENGGFWDQTAIAGNACLTSPNPMAEAPATLIFIAAFSSRSFSAEQLGHLQWRVSKSRCSKI